MKSSIWVEVLTNKETIHDWTLQTDRTVGANIPNRINKGLWAKWKYRTKSHSERLWVVTSKLNQKQWGWGSRYRKTCVAMDVTQTPLISPNSKLHTCEAEYNILVRWDILKSSKLLYKKHPLFVRREFILIVWRRNPRANGPTATFCHSAVAT